MRTLVTIIVAMFAVACSQSDQKQAEATASDVGGDIQAAAKDAGQEIKEGYETAKPGLEALGEKAEAAAEKAGKVAKREIHEATAPTPEEQAEQAKPAASQ